MLLVLLSSPGQLPVTVSLGSPNLGLAMHFAVPPMGGDGGGMRSLTMGVLPRPLWSSSFSWETPVLLRSQSSAILVQASRACRAPWASDLWLDPWRLLGDLRGVLARLWVRDSLGLPEGFDRFLESSQPESEPGCRGRAGPSRARIRNLSLHPGGSG